MDKAETLQRIRVAEAQIRTSKEAAEGEREMTLRDARREALDIVEKYRGQAETRYQEIVASAVSSVESEREKMLAAAREEAARTTDRGRANVDRAVDLVLSKFRGAIRA